MPFEISHSKVETIILMNLKGTIVAGNDKQKLIDALQEILATGETNIILDLGEITFADSTGIGGLIAAASLAARKGGSVKLLHLTKRIHDVLQITRLSTVFGIYDDLQKAIESFEAQG